MHSTTQTSFELLHDPHQNMGTAFTEAEREAHGLVGLLPEGVDDASTLVRRAKMQLAQKPNALEKYIYLSELQDRNERLFYRLVMDDPATYMPIVYTPTVGEACQHFHQIMRRPKGLYVSLKRRHHIRAVLRNWPYEDVRFIVVTDGERILGLGDLGIGGMGIPIGKLSLYTACAGVPPEVTLPITLDVGTNNDELLTDPLYLGLRRHRARGEEYDSFIDEFVLAVQDVFPRCCIQFEDFTKLNAFPILERWRDRVCCFNDDIQGTASVAVAGLFGACRILGNRLRDHRFLFLGAGSAAVGIADLIVDAMVRDGLSRDEARGRIWLQNSRGLVTRESTGLEPQQARYAHTHAPVGSFPEAVEAVKPTGIIGVSTQPKTFDRRVIEAMSRFNERPVIFPYSNPTSRSECTAEEAYTWSNGRAIFASGSPFAALKVNGQLFVPGQGNNVYIYPAVGLAVYATQAKRVTDEMFLRAAEALASQVTDDDLSHGLIYPPLSEIRTAEIHVAVEVAQLIFDRGLARTERPDDVEAFVRSKVWTPHLE